MYLTSTKPNIMHTINLISTYMENPAEVHLLAVKRIFCYLKGTTNFEILYKNYEKSSLFGYSDSDYAEDPDDRKDAVNQPVDADEDDDRGHRYLWRGYQQNSQNEGGDAFQ